MWSSSSRLVQRASGRIIYLANNSSSNNKRLFSTATTAAVVLEEEEEQPLQKDEPPSGGRPRLQALRQQLQQEDDGVAIWKQSKAAATTTKKPKQQPSSAIITEATTNTPPKSSLDEILAILSQLPDDVVSPEKDNMLVDKYHRKHSYLRISLTEKCNLRCQYCMPPEGVPIQPASKLLQTNEILQLTKIFVQQGGVNKIRLTGGEPTLRNDLVELVEGIQQLDAVKQIGMTTNGVTLSKQLPDLIQAGLTHVNVSLDTLQETKFIELTRRKGLQRVYKSIEDACRLLALSNADAGRVKINVVVMKNCNDDELKDFVLLTTKLPVDVRFIEWMPFSSNGWNQDRFVSYDEMLNSLLLDDELDLKRIDDGPHDTTKWWQLPENALGRVGFITSMSQHFCGTCNRLRLTADGQIKVCLFGSTELSLRDAMRSPDVSEQDLCKLIHYAVQRKHFALGGHGSAQGIADADDNRPMTLIGG